MEKSFSRMSFATPKNLAFAKHMRANMTDAEQPLWRILRNRRFVDYKFRRQVPVGTYIADFMCIKAKLIIEADGSQHFENMRDSVRDEWFQQQGFYILRFWNHDILNLKTEIMDAIWYKLTRESYE